MRLYQQRLFIIILFALLLSSCSSSREKTRIISEENNAEEMEQDIVSTEAKVDEPIYVYKMQPVQNLAKIVLELNADPLLLPAGYVRLAGVVSGGRPAHRRSKSEGGPLALIEVGGRGLCLGIGDKFGDYQVSYISERSMIFRKGVL